MISEKFREGDRVSYRSHSGRMVEGIICANSDIPSDHPLRTSPRELAVFAYWDRNQYDIELGLPPIGWMPESTVTLIQPAELQYDPSQQGDTDEDI